MIVNAVAAHPTMVRFTSTIFDCCWLIQQSKTEQPQDNPPAYDSAVESAKECAYTVRFLLLSGVVNVFRRFRCSWVPTPEFSHSSCNDSWALVFPPIIDWLTYCLQLCEAANWRTSSLPITSRSSRNDLLARGRAYNVFEFWYPWSVLYLMTQFLLQVKYFTGVLAAVFWFPLGVGLCLLDRQVKCRRCGAIVEPGICHWQFFVSRYPISFFQLIV